MVKRPTTIGILLVLKIRYQRAGLVAAQQARQSNGGKQHPSPAVEILTGIVCFEIGAQFGYADRRAFILTARVAGGGSDRQGRQGRAVLKDVGRFVWLKPEVQPLPGSVRPLLLPKLRQRFAGRFTQSFRVVAGVRPGQNEQVQHHLGSA